MEAGVRLFSSFSCKNCRGGMDSKISSVDVRFMCDKAPMAGVLPRKIIHP